MLQAEHKLTDELERQLIQREMDGDAPGHGYALELVVGTLLILGALLAVLHV